MSGVRGVTSLRGRFPAQLLRTAAAAFIDEHQPMVWGQGQQIREKVIVRATRSAMQHHQGRALADGLVPVRR